VDSDDVDLLESVEVYRSYARVQRLKLRHRCYAGDKGPVLTRDVVRTGDAVAVLPYDPATDQVVLIEQFRVGPYAGGAAEPWLIEIVAGVIEDGETPDEVARREALEEAGLRLDDLVPALAYYPSPGVLTEHVQLYCARVDASEAGGVHGLDEEGEDIRVLVWSFAEAMAALSQGRIRASPAVVGLQWLALNRDRLRRRWASG
jgi:ADP-ribose diphosphatase